MPQLKLFRSELLPKDNRYASVVYYAAVAAFNLEKNEKALRYFQEYLNTGTEAQQKDCYVYMNMIYQNRRVCDEERVLEQAIAKYPVSLDFLYNLVNVHIATNNMEKLIEAIDRILGSLTRIMIKCCLSRHASWSVRERMWRHWIFINVFMHCILKSLN